jgi:hypothetical protein
MPCPQRPRRIDSPSEVPSKFSFTLHPQPWNAWLQICAACLCACAVGTQSRCLTQSWCLTQSRCMRARAVCLRRSPCATLRKCGVAHGHAYAHVYVYAYAYEHRAVRYALTTWVALGKWPWERHSWTSWLVSLRVTTRPGTIAVYLVDALCVLRGMWGGAYRRCIDSGCVSMITRQ